MQNLRILRQRIRSVANTQKITRAMQMVAGAKLRRAQGELMDFKPYAQRLRVITNRLLEAHPTLEHPLLEKQLPVMVSLSNHDRVKNRSPFDRLRANGTAPAGLIIVSSDTGLCGTYNEKVLSAAEGFLRENPSAVLVTIGKKGTRTLARRGVRRTKEILDWGGRYESSKAGALARWMQELYLNGTVSSWWVAYTRFISAMRWKPAVERFLPIERPPSPALPEKIIVEPAPAAAASGSRTTAFGPEPVAEELLKRFIAGEFRRILLEAFTSEHSARMIAMKNATDNAAEMIQNLTLVRNKVRQAAITKELIEVVSGAEALK
ncbi:MAG: ATP synthase F1 subunit gamma [Candidatus Omnitrophica bacterium]|nr:ATP synthase F1 subunit gamma [Candidatus Omnitrophota bacterium]